jgi:hypothetical protein
MRGMRRRDRRSRRQRDGTASVGGGGDAARHGGRTIVGDHRWRTMRVIRTSITS